MNLEKVKRQKEKWEDDRRELQLNMRAGILGSAERIKKHNRRWTIWAEAHEDELQLLATMKG